MRPGLGLLLALAATAGVASVGQASLVEDLLPISYQNDGGIGEDAGADCAPDAPVITLNHGGEGQMVAFDDETDTWALSTSAADDGKRVVMSLESNPDNRRLQSILTFPMTFQVFDPLCNVVVASGSANQCKAQGDPATCKQASSFVIGDGGGIYTIQVDLHSDDPRFPIVQEILGLVPDNAHCSPMCFWDYVALPRTVN